MKTYLIVPTNEGQELNYVHTFTGTMDQAKSKALYMTAKLQDVLIQGEIGCLIQDQSGKELAFLTPRLNWETTRE